MRFNRVGAALGVVFLALGTSSCGKYHLFSSARSEEGPIKMESSEVGCLSRTSNTFKDFIDGKATDERINDVWHCAKRSLELFDEHVKGSVPGQYQPEELRAFLEKYFIKDGGKISNDLMKDSMELKAAILGGRADVITSAELARARELFGIFQNRMLRLRPYFPLNSLAVSGTPDSKVDQAALELEQAGAEIGRAIQLTAQPYSIDHLDRMFAEMAAIRNNDTLKKLSDRVHMVRAAKSVIVAPPATAIADGEWERLFAAAGKVASIYVRFHHIEKNYRKTWVCGVGRERMLRVLDDGQELLGSAIRNHPGGVIQFTEMDELLDTLDWTIKTDHRDLTGRKFMDTIKETIRPVIRKTLGGMSSGATGRDASGLTANALARAWSGFLEWNDDQRYLEASFAKLGRFECDGDSKNPYGVVNVNYSMEQLLALPVQDALSAASDVVEELRTTMNHSHHLSSDTSEEIVFPIDGAEDQHTFYNLSQMNLLRLGTKMVIDGYMSLDDPMPRASQSLTIDEFDQFYRDMRNAAIESEYIDYHRTDTAKRRFREANLFLFNSNGDMFLDRAEGFELMVFLGSTKKLSDRYLSEIAGLCSGTDNSGLYGKTSVPVDCFRKIFFENIDRYLVRMPGMVKFYHSLSDKKLTAFQDNMMAIAADGLAPGKRVDVIGSEKLAMLLHYTEVAFARFDADRSSTLDVAETAAAYKVFAPTFAVMVRERTDYFKTNDDFEALFAYLLCYGKMPAATYGGGADFWVWKERKGSRWDPWVIAADRGMVLAIFAELSKKQ